jgi:hypothetical protein
MKPVTTVNSIRIDQNQCGLAYIILAAERSIRQFNRYRHCENSAGI